jgi:hypothetical protein
MLDNQLNTPKANITDTLTVNDATVGGDLVVTGTSDFNGVTTIGSTLTVTGSTALGSVVKINALGSVGTQTCRLLSWDNTAAYDSKQIRTSGDLYYNGTTETLHVPNVAVDDATVGGNTILNTLSVSGQATFGSDCTISSSKDLFFTEQSTTITGDKGTIKWDSIGRVTGRRSSALQPRLEFVNESARPNTLGNYQIQLSPNDVNLSTPVSGKITQRIDNVVKTTLNNANFTVSTDLVVTGDTTVTAVNATTTPVNTNCRLLYLEGNGLTGRISGNGCYYNPDGDVLFANRLQGSEHCRSPEFLMTYTGQGNGQIKQVIHTDTELYLQYQQTKGHLFKNGVVTKLLIPDTISTFYNDVDVVGSLTVGSFAVGALNASVFQYTNGLPVGYSCTYNCFDWRVYNYTVSQPHGTFGLDRYAVLHRTNTGGHSPSVTQHGANIFSGSNPVVRSAINFAQTGSNAHWKIASAAYAGIWKVRVSCVFQNLSPHRQTPKIYLQKYTGTAWIEQPHISTAIDYARHDVGELVTLNLEGVVYLTTTNNVLRIMTLLEIHAVNSPPTWPDDTTDWAGRDINIQMEFLGTGTSTTGEITNAL